jgi:hypothetical protein
VTYRRTDEPDRHSTIVITSVPLLGARNLLVDKNSKSRSLRFTRDDNSNAPVARGVLLLVQGLVEPAFRLALKVGPSVLFACYAALKAPLHPGLTRLTIS